MTSTEGQPSVNDAREQNYYELLEVGRQSTRSEIVQAYHRAKAAFAPDSLATYTLYSPEEAQKISARIEKAFRVLVDGRKRALYDQWLEAVERGEDAPPPDFAHTDAGAIPRTAQPPNPEPAAGEAGEDSSDAPAQKEPASTTDSEERVEKLLAETDGCDGRLLRRVREARGLTLEQISGSTKISPMNLRFIEEDNYGSLPAPVYLRGFLQQIARCLRIDSERVVESYMSRVDRWRSSK